MATVGYRGIGRRGRAMGAAAQAVVMLLTLALAVLPGAAAATLPGPAGAVASAAGAMPDAALPAAMEPDCPMMRAAPMDPAHHGVHGAPAEDAGAGPAAGTPPCGHDACCPVGACLAPGPLPAAPPPSAAPAPVAERVAAPALALRHDRPPRTAPIL